MLGAARAAQSAKTTAIGALLDASGRAAQPGYRAYAQQHQRPGEAGCAACLDGARAPALKSGICMKLSLGPLQYYWQRSTVFDFYEAMAATAVDTVYLGEVTCSRRHELRLSDWLDVARLLRGAGKSVVLSTMVLLESGSDVGAMQKIAANEDFLVEANDMGAVGALAEHKPFVAGPHLNIYNAPSLRWGKDSTSRNTRRGKHPKTSWPGCVRCRRPGIAWTWSTRSAPGPGRPNSCASWSAATSTTCTPAAAARWATCCSTLME